MSMVRQETLGVKGNPFNEFICANCGRRLGRHWIFRPDKFADVRPGDRNGRKPDGRLYCHRDQAGWAHSYYQRRLRRSLEPAGYRP